MPLLVVFGESDAWPGALPVAAELAKKCGDGLVVLITAAAMGNAQRLQKKAETVLQDAAVEVRYRIVASTDIPQIVRTARLERADTVVVAGSSPLIRREDFPDLVAGIGCSVFIVR